MKIKRILTAALAVTILLLSLTACSGNNTPVEGTNPLSEEALKLCGSWAYNHDTETAAAIFYENGTAEYNDKKYMFTCDDQFLHLTDKSGELLQVRYVLDEKGLLLYETKTYTYTDEGTADSLLGSWENVKDNWSFVFLEDGMYMEDSVFTGHYTVDEENSSFTLDYNGQFDATVCYYQLEGNNLIIEYPWRLLNMDNNISE